MLRLTPHLKIGTWGAHEQSFEYEIPVSPARVPGQPRIKALLAYLKTQPPIVPYKLAALF
jgi:hypothetical protein